MGNYTGLRDGVVAQFIEPLDVVAQFIGLLDVGAQFIGLLRGFSDERRKDV